VKALLLRDLRLAIRAGGGFGLGLAFFLIVVVLVPFGVGPEAGLLTKFEDGALALLATSPLPLEAVSVIKALAHWITTGLPLCFAAPVLGFLLHLDATAYWFLIISLLIGTPALSMIGTFGAALTVGLRRGGLLLSLLVLPLYVPTLIMGADAVRRGGDGMIATTPLMLLGVITLGSIAVLPFATAAALRVNLR